MDDTTLTAYYDVADPSSFGYALANFGEAAVSAQYGCANAANCTADEIASLQWTNSTITLSPLDPNDPVYTPSSDTTANWGHFPVYGSETPPEYYYYVQQMGVQSNNWMSDLQLARIVDNGYDLYGLANFYNGGRLMSGYLTNNQTTLDAFQTALILQDVSQFTDIMRNHIQGYIMGGAFANYTLQELLYGWESSIPERINGGNYSSGADYDIQSSVTVVFND